MTIKYTNFSDGIHELEFQEPVEKLKLDSTFFGNLVLTCKMDKSAHQIVLDCSLSVNSRFNCDRCGVEFVRELKNHFILSFLFSKERIQSEDLNLKFLSPDLDKIDLTEDVIEYTKLAVPMKKLCREDCKGLCSKCGANLNEEQCGCKVEIVSDVWAPLKKLKDCI